MDNCEICNLLFNILEMEYLIKDNIVHRGKYICRECQKHYSDTNWIIKDE